MARRRDESGTPNTCPLIDIAIAALDRCECEDVDTYEAKGALEKVRSINDELRSWGNDQYYELQDRENTIAKLESEIEDYQDEIKNLLAEIKELESRET